jgi:hypothetical protein
MHAAYSNGGHSHASPSQCHDSALERGFGGDDLSSPVTIRPLLNAGKKQNRKAVHVPKRLLAHDSWKLFSAAATSRKRYH